LKQKNKNIKTLFLTYGGFNHASSRIRAIQYFNLFEKELNFNISWIPRTKTFKKNNLAFKSIVLPILKRFFTLKRFLQIFFNQYELVFIQRFFLEKYLISLLKKRNTKIVYDFDDAIFLGNNGKNESNTLRLLNSADSVIVSAPELFLFCKSHKISAPVLIANSPIEIERFTLRKEIKKERVTIGWIGSYYTTPYLYNIKNALIKLSKIKNFELLLIGASNIHFDNIIIKTIAWSFEKEPENLSLMDIGIMPLPDDEFAKGKGSYKLFQYMAAGIPLIASPVGLNSQIVQNGQNGFLATTEDEWIKYLSILIDDPLMRTKMGNIGRKTAEEKYDRKIIFGHIKKELQKIIENEH